MIAALVIFALQTASAGALLVQRRRKQRVERLLKQSEERMAFTAASANVGLWQFDRTSSTLWATEHCRALFGLKKDAHDVRAVLSDKQTRWIRIRGRAIFDEGGSPNRLSGLFADVTEQKASEAEAALQRQEIAHLMRVSPVGQVVCAARLRVASVRPAVRPRSPPMHGRPPPR